MKKCARCGRAAALQESLVPGLYTCGPGLCAPPLCDECDGTGEQLNYEDPDGSDFEDCDACDGTGLEARA